MERDEPIGSLPPEEAARFDRLRGVSNREGIIDPPFDRVRPLKDPGRYVVLRVGYFAYNPMRINVGSIGLVRGEGQTGKISPDYVVFTTRRTLLPEYLFAYLKSDVGRQIIRASTAGAVRERLYFRDLACLPIPLPPVQEQRRLVGILDSAEELRRLREQADRRTTNLIPAIFHQAFGDPASNPKGWPLTTLADVADVQSGLTLGGRRKRYSLVKPYLRVANVQRGYLELKEIKEIHLTGEEFTRVHLQRGDVLLVEGNGNPKGIGRAAIWDGSIDECVHQNHLIRVRPSRDTLLPEFLSSFLNSDSGKDYFFGAGNTTSGLVTISTRIVKQCRIPLPPLPLQRDFTARVAEAGALEAQQAASRRRLDDLFQSLLHRAFRGEL